MFLESRQLNWKLSKWLGQVFELYNRLEIIPNQLDEGESS